HCLLNGIRPRPRTQPPQRRQTRTRTRARPVSRQGINHRFRNKFESLEESPPKTAGTHVCCSGRFLLNVQPRSPLEMPVLATPPGLARVQESSKNTPGAFTKRKPEKGCNRCRKKPARP